MRVPKERISAGLVGAPELVFFVTEDRVIVNCT